MIGPKPMRRALACLASLLTLCHEMRCEAQVELSKPTSEAISLDLDSTTAKRLVSVEDFVVEQRWPEAVAILRQAQFERSDKLVPIADGWYVGVTRYVQCRAALLPVAGLAEYRRQSDATAITWLESAERSQNRSMWRRIEREAAATSSGRPAVARLAEEAFERGDFATARSKWEKLLPASQALRASGGVGLLRLPGAEDRAAVELRAKLILCSLFSGDVRRARRERDWIRQQIRGLNESADSLFQDVLNPVDDLLNEMTRTANTREEARVATQSNVRERPTNSATEPSRSWSVSLPMTAWQSAPSAKDRSDEINSDLFPVLANNTVFVSNGESIFAFHATTGLPQWSNADQRDITTATIYSVADPVASTWSITGRPQCSLTIQGERLYARLGTPVTGRAKQERHAHSELVGLDIGSGEGKLVWRIDVAQIPSADVNGDSAAWCFEGSPVADDRRVFAVLRRSLPQQQINVACFDADTGRLVWNRKIGVTLEATDETVNSASHLQLALAEDTVLVATHSGAIAALEADDGLIRWLRTYRPASAEVRDRSHDSTICPLIRDGVAYVAPLDSNQVFAIHLESGLKLWEREWPDPIQRVIGIHDKTWLVQGRSLWGIDIETGKPAWSNRQVGFDDTEGQSAGQGVLIGHRVFWPNRDELFEVSAATGDILSRIPLSAWTGERGGHLTFHDSWLVLTRGHRLTCWPVPNELR